MCVNEKNLDKLAFDLATNDEITTKGKIYQEIASIAKERGVFLASIQGLYEARGRGECKGFTVPAVNLRALTYDSARAFLRAAKRNNVGAFIFEIAKSEIGYTDQRPVEYAGCCMAAALREGWEGPLFIQGDHFQVNAKKYKEDRGKEISMLKNIIDEAIGAGFYNIDIDSSTLVDIDKPDVLQQQEDNAEVCAELTAYIRAIEPKGITISVGGEIGEVGGKNSTPEELEAFMTLYLEKFKNKLKKDAKGISKISIQTGTAHGGVVLPSGEIAKVKLDFGTLEDLSKIARGKFGLAGAVQHGASTLPEDAFHKFPQTETAEVHLATQFQNMIYEHVKFPSDLRDEIYRWIETNLQKEKKDKDTNDQFIYKTRKKALGPFKKRMWSLDDGIRGEISKSLEDKFEFLFKQLKVVNTQDLVKKHIEQREVVGAGQLIGKRITGEDLEGAD